MKIVKQQGRRVPKGFEQSTADRTFGNKTINTQQLRPGSVQAFGDTSGQQAIANSLINVGSTFFDIAKRESAMQRAEDDARLKQMLNEFDNQEQEIRYSLDQEDNELFRTPDEKLAAYDERVKESRLVIRNQYDFKTRTSASVDSYFDEKQSTRNLEYRAGTIERARVDSVKAAQYDSLKTYVNAAHHAGRENNVERLVAVMNEIKDTTSHPSFIATHGQGQARLIEQDKIVLAAKGFVSELAERNPKDAKELIESEDGLLTQLIDQEDLLIVKEDLQNIVARELRQTEITEHKRVEDLVGKASLGIQLGKVGKADVLAMGIPEGKKAILLSKIDSTRRDSLTAQQGYDEITNVLNLGGSYLHQSKKKLKVVDAWLPIRMQELSNDPEVARQVIIEEVGQIGIVPSVIKSGITSGLSGNDPQRAQQAASDLVALVHVNPSLAKDFTQQEQGLVSLLKLNVPLDQARQSITRSFQMTDVERKEWKKVADEQLVNVNDDIKEVIENNFNWEFGSETVPIPTGAKVDYMTLYRANLTLTQSPQAAKEMTKAQFLTTWSRTKVGGVDRLMKFSPEAMYGDRSEKTANDLQLILEKDLAEFGVTDADQIHLVAHPDTIGTNTKYIVSVRKGGVYAPIVDRENQPVLWGPDLDQLETDKRLLLQKEVAERLALEKEEQKNFATHKQKAQLSGLGIDKVGQTIVSSKDQAADFIVSGGKKVADILVTGGKKVAKLFTGDITKDKPLLAGYIGSWSQLDSKTKAVVKQQLKQLADTGDQWAVTNLLALEQESNN